MPEAVGIEPSSRVTAEDPLESCGTYEQHPPLAPPVAMQPLPADNLSPLERARLRSGRHHHTSSATMQPRAAATCLAIYPFEAESSDELSFKAGETITLLSKIGLGQGWWQGQIGGRTGVFPENYVKEMQLAHQ